jgi:copper homeostasis protein
VGPGRSKLLEIIACSVEDAQAAAAGGADRIELISHYEVGGLTPPLDLVRDVLTAVSLPVRVMLRDRESFEVVDLDEIALLCQRATALDELARTFPHLEGVVLGFLRSPGPVLDLELIGRVLGEAPHLRATLHRATEDLPDPGSALAAVASFPAIDTFLTSGGPEPWADKVERLADWQRRAGDRTILVGGGVDAEAMAVLSQSEWLRAFHLGVAVRRNHQIDGPVIAAEVRAVTDQLRSLRSNGRSEESFD